MEFFGTIASATGVGGTVSHIGHLGGLISGFIFIIFKRSKSGKSESSDISKSKLNQFLTQERLKKKQQEIDKRIQAKNIIDSLLEKIAREGMSSLSHKEKSDLEWARKHYYPNEDDTVH
jgi:hypothetical protein